MMPSPIDKALSGQTLSNAAAVHNQGGIPESGAGLTGGGMSETIAALLSGQMGAEQLLQLILALSGGGGMGAGAPMPGPMPGGAPGPGGPIQSALM